MAEIAGATRMTRNRLLPKCFYRCSHSTLAILARFLPLPCHFGGKRCATPRRICIQSSDQRSNRATACRAIRNVREARLRRRRTHLRELATKVEPVL